MAEPWQRIVSIGAGNEPWQRFVDLALPPFQLWQVRVIVAAGEPWQRQRVAAVGEPYQRRET